MTPVTELFGTGVTHRTNSLPQEAEGWLPPTDMACNSVWISGWTDYAALHPMQARQVYLSLGKREEHARDPDFAQVGTRIREEYAQLQQQIGDCHCTLEWNPGGHFVDCEQRLARAFRWNLRKLRQ